MPDLECYIGEIRIWPSHRIPRGWSLCDGKLMSINGNEALYAVIGNVYGGDGRTTFALPDLRTKVPLGEGQSAQTKTVYALGKNGGQELTTLNIANLATHNHGITTAGQITPPSGLGKGIPATNSKGTTDTPSPSTCLAKPVAMNGKTEYPVNMYSGATPDTTITGQSFSDIITVEPTGSSQPFSNMQPFTVVTYIIALGGLFPSPD